MIEKIIYKLLFLSAAFSNNSNAQNVFDFNILMDGTCHQFEIHDTTFQVEHILIEHKSESKKGYCQESKYQNGMKSLFCFDPDTETSYYYEVDSLDRIRLYSTKTNIKWFAYTYYPSGKLKSYSIKQEDTLFNNHNSFSRSRLTSDSFTLNYYEDGSTESIIYFTPGIQNLTIYWPNKKKKIFAEFDANRYSFCGKYLEFDEDGNILIKGRYYLSDDPLSPSIKIGVWKYFEGGKLKTKEKHKIK